jgi:hypothetical protein
MGTDKVIFVGEQWGATGSHVTGSDVTGSRVTGRGHVRNRKSISTSTWLPVTEGHPKVTRRVEGRAHAQPEVVQYTLVGPFHRKLATGSDIIFSRILLSSSAKCWFGVFSTTSASTPFPGYLPL